MGMLRVREFQAERGEDASVDGVGASASVVGAAREIGAMLRASSAAVAHDEAKSEERIGESPGGQRETNSSNTLSKYYSEFMCVTWHIPHICP